MDTETTKKNFEEVMEFVEQLKRNSPKAKSPVNSNLPMDPDEAIESIEPSESTAHEKLRNQVAPLLEKVHEDYNKLFCEAYEEHDEQKAEKLRKLLEQMLIMIRSSE